MVQAELPPPPPQPVQVPFMVKFCTVTAWVAVLVTKVAVEPVADWMDPQTSKIVAGAVVPPPTLPAFK